MYVNKQKLALKVGPSEVEQESTEGEIYLGLVICIETVDELSIGLDAMLVLKIPGSICRVGVDDLSA